MLMHQKEINQRKKLTRSRSAGGSPVRAFNAILGFQGSFESALICQHPLTKARSTLLARITTDEGSCESALIVCSALAWSLRCRTRFVESFDGIWHRASVRSLAAFVKAGIIDQAEPAYIWICAFLERLRFRSSDTLYRWANS